MPRGENTQSGKQGFQPTDPKTRPGATAPSAMPVPLRAATQADLDAARVDAEGGYDYVYALYRRLSGDPVPRPNPARATSPLVSRCVECGSSDDIQPTSGSGDLCKACRVAFTIDHDDTPTAVLTAPDVPVYEFHRRVCLHAAQQGWTGPVPGNP